MRLLAGFVLIVCTLAAVLTAGAPQLASPNQSGLVPVIVRDRRNRFVDGLQEDNFVILENGFRRPITNFSDADSPVTLAIISESPLPMRDMLRPEDELIQTSSLSGALRQLVTSRNPRKAIIITTTADMGKIPGIQVVHADPADVFKVVIELRNQYLLQYRPSDPSAHVEVALKQPRGLPFLKATWKAPF